MSLSLSLCGSFDDVIDVVFLFHLSPAVDGLPTPQPFTGLLRAWGQLTPDTVLLTVAREEATLGDCFEQADIETEIMTMTQRMHTGADNGPQVGQGVIVTSLASS